MIAIILGAGRGKRFGDLTLHNPKPLILVNGIPLIVHTLNNLPKEISRCIIVIGYLGSQIVELIGSKYKHISIEYVYQNELNGTGGALLKVKDKIINNDRFLVINADDIYKKSDLNKMICYDMAYGIALREPIKMGLVSVLIDHMGMYHGRVCPNSGHKCYIGVGAYVFTKDIFSVEFVKISNGELSLPHSLDRINVPIKTVIFLDWYPVNDKTQLAIAKENI